MSALREMGRYGSVGFEFVLTLGVGFFGGRWLDRRFATGGILTWVGLIVGIVAAFAMLVVTAKRMQAQMEKDDAEEARAEAVRAALSKAETPQETRGRDAQDPPNEPPEPPADAR